MKVVVPGPWQGRSDLTAAVRKASDRFVFAGRDLKRVDGDELLPVAVVDHSLDLANTFKELGPAAGLSGADLRYAFLGATIVHVPCAIAASRPSFSTWMRTTD